MRRGLLQATILSFLVITTKAYAQDANDADGLKPLNHFVGVWKTAVTDKPTKALPNGAKRTDSEFTSWILKDRFILGRQTSQPSGDKFLWLMTHDSKTNTYPLWFFSSNGVLGGEWSNTWDEANKTLTGKATDTPAGWTSHGTNIFPDENSDHVSVWMKDDAGTLLFDSEARKGAPTGISRQGLSKHMDERRQARCGVGPRIQGFAAAHRILGRNRPFKAGRVDAEGGPHDEQDNQNVGLGSAFRARHFACLGWHRQIFVADLRFASEEISRVVVQF